MSEAPAEAPQASDSSATSSSQDTKPRCLTTGKRKMAITCDYTPMPVDSVQAAGQPHIALNHSELSFKTDDDNWMHLELRFTRLDSGADGEARRVYIEIDGDSGENFIRRPLPSVDLARLSPGQPTEFNERLVFPALRPGHYQIKLWAPSADPAFQFDASHNLLLSSFGVAEEKSRLNAIAAFSVTR